MVEKKPLISIIVPFYNIERCVGYCMESLLNQTFRDYEIICIDDGSTDSTGDLLDEYSVHPNVFVFHRQNGGLSAARNYGINVAKGDLVSFVDGDDVVSPYYLEVLEKSFRECDGGMIVGNVCYVSITEAEGSSIRWEVPSKGLHVEKNDLIEKYSYEEKLPGAVCRLAPLDLYKNRPFPLGVYYEEIATAAGFVLDVESVMVVETAIYGYVMRSGSIVHPKKARFKQVEDYVDAIDHFNEAAGWDKQDPARIHFECLSYSRIYRLLDVVTDAGEDAKEMQKAISKYVRSNLKVLLNDKRVKKGNKARFIILGMTPGIYDKIFKLYEGTKSTHRGIS